MFKIKKGTVLIAAVVVLSIFVYYRYATEIFQANRSEDAVEVASVAPVGSKEVSAEVSFDTPGDYAENLRFIVTVDKQGVIENVKTVDAVTNEISKRNATFNEEISVVLRGKKLSDLTAIDKVGKSSLTTTAFNSVIDQLKSQL